MHKEAFDLLSQLANSKLQKSAAMPKTRSSAAPAAGVRAVNNAATGIAGGVAGGARQVGRAASGLGRSVASDIASIPGEINSGINSTRSGVQNIRAGANNALAGVRGDVRQMRENIRGNSAAPATLASTPQSYADMGIMSSSQLPPVTPEPPQFFNVKQPQEMRAGTNTEIDFERDLPQGMRAGTNTEIDFERDLPQEMHGYVTDNVPRQRVTSFEQLPQDFQERFRQRQASGTVAGASDEDAVKSYNQHYANTTRQLTPLPANPRVAYGTRGRQWIAQHNPNLNMRGGYNPPSQTPAAIASR